MIDTKNKLVGIEFLDMQYKRNVVDCFSDKYNSYLVSNDDIPGCQSIMSESDIEFYLNKQDKIIESKNKSEQQEKDLLQRKTDEEQKYNFCYGYCDKLTALQRGKVLSALNKNINYISCGYGVMTRKDFVYKALEDGYKPSVRYDVHYCSNRTESGYTVKPTVYCINWEDGSYNEITKTEYDYAIYLINNVL